MATQQGHKNGQNGTKTNPLATITHAPMNVIRGNTALLGQSAADAMIDAAEMSKVIRTYIMSEFKPGIDYGAAFPGAPKPSLLKGGAQKIQMLLNCRSKAKRICTELGDGHLEVETTVVFVNRATGNIMSWGTGSATTMESKHRFRNANRVCPSCGAAKVKKGAEKFGGGWYCNAKDGGCGANFKGDSPAASQIDAQVVGQVENENPWDQRNTVLKMSYKRALVDAADSAACLSEFFTQDIDDAFTEDQIVDMATPPIVDVVNHKAGQTFDAESYIKENAGKPKPAPVNPAAPPPAADVEVLGQRTPGFDKRSYLDVAKGAASEANSQFASVAQAAGVKDAPASPFTANMTHNAVAKALLESGATTVKPKDSAESLKLITEELYPKRRDAIRQAINAFFEGQLKATRARYAETPKEPEKTDDDPGFEGEFDLKNPPTREPGEDG